MLRQFWAELNTPTDYAADPYGGATNQIGHIALGAVLFGGICLAYAAKFGEMPVKEYSALPMIVFYFFVVELWHQRSPIKDAIQDAFFFACGVMIIATSFTEVSSDHPDYILLRLERANAFAALSVIVVSLALYIIPRAARKYREQEI